MKMDIKYEQADIKRLILNNLKRQGITARVEDIAFDKKGTATISVEVSADDIDPEPTFEPQVSTSAGPTPATEYATQRPAPPPSPEPSPPLEVIEGGNNPVDMSGILHASKKNLRDRPAPFPSPKQHSLLEGESFDFPGDK